MGEVLYASPEDLEDMIHSQLKEMSWPAEQMPASDGL